MSTLIPAWLCIPFAGLLLSIAVVPLVAGEWWEKHRVHAVIFWSLLFIVPFTVLYGPLKASETVLETVFNDYLSFIVMLFGLFCVAGNITFTGDLAGSPFVNTLFLLIGTLLSSIIGTTGSSMLMLRPMIKINAWRRQKRHIMIFFIFLILIFNLVILLTVFWQLDKHYYLKDVRRGYRPDISKPGTELSLRGAHNIIFLLMIIIAVVLGGTLPSNPMFQTAEGTVRGLHIIGEVTLGFPTIIEIALILAAAFLSFKTTPDEIRRANHFTWGAIQEVAELFIGIFITMQPALMILKEMGPKLGLTEPFQMFWATGLLSSFLDNTPTYLVFLTTAGTLGMTTGLTTTVGTIPQIFLEAISCGAVFMGANSYIGNAPNFMVKSISDENGIHMPSFFGYIGWALVFLVPVFVIDTLIFFLF